MMLGPVSPTCKTLMELFVGEKNPVLVQGSSREYIMGSKAIGNETGIFCQYSDTAV